MCLYIIIPLVSICEVLLDCMTIFVGSIDSIGMFRVGRTFAPRVGAESDLAEQKMLLDSLNSRFFINKIQKLHGQCQQPQNLRMLSQSACRSHFLFTKSWGPKAMASGTYRWVQWTEHRRTSKLNSRILIIFDRHFSRILIILIILIRCRIFLGFRMFL